MQREVTTLVTMIGALLSLSIIGCANLGRKDDNVPTEANVNLWVPMGTHVSEAQAVMEQHGFTCWRHFWRPSTFVQSNSPVSTNLFDSFIKSGPPDLNSALMTFDALVSQEPFNPRDNSPDDCLYCRRFEPGSARASSLASDFEGWYEVRFFVQSNCVSKIEVWGIFKGL